MTVPLRAAGNIARSDRRCHDGPVAGPASAPADRLADAAARALATSGVDARVSLGDPLRGGRARVVRATATTDDGTVLRLVLKAPADAGEGWVRERAALGVLRDHDVAGTTRLLAASEDPPLLVLADVGEHLSLADALLGRDARAAQDAVVAWAAALGRLQDATAGLRAPFEQALGASGGLGPPPVDDTADLVVATAGALRRLLPRVGLELSGDAEDELRSIAADLDTSAPGTPGALVPGDTCPDNALLARAGPVLLDWEGATHRHVAWEAAYLVVPWPSCWCSWAMPPEVADGALAAWRTTLAPSAPAVAEVAFAEDLLRARTAWAFVSLGWFLPAALDGDPPPAQPALAGLVPRRAAMLQHRLDGVATGEAPLPALVGLAARAHRALVEHLGPAPLALAPAFR